MNRKDKTNDMKYIFLISEATSKNQLWMYKDIENEPDVKFIPPWGGKNIMTKSIRMFLIKIGKLFKIDIIKGINTRRFKIKPDENYCVVIEAGYLTTCKKTFFSNLRQHKNVKIFLLLVDSMSGHSASLRSVREQVLGNNWDEIFTFEKDDSDKYGWNYSGIHCSSLPIAKQIETGYDIYFVGGLKGERSNLLFPVYDRMIRNGISCKFDLWYQNEEEFEDCHRRIREMSENFEKSGIKDIGLITLRKHFLKYGKVTKNVQASKVIFEVLQKGQSAHTLRWFEAIFYNKKLITNNQNIQNLPFYNDKYMKCISCADDIDIDFIKREEKIDYGYAGELSPIHLLEKIRTKAEQAK